MGPLMKRLALTPGKTGASHDYEMARGRALSYRHVLHKAQQQLEQGVSDETSYKKVVAFYKDANEKAQADAVVHAAAQATPERLLEAAKSLALVEREALNHALSAGMISSGTCAELIADLNARLDELDSAAQESDEALQETLQRLYGGLAEAST